MINRICRSEFSDPELIDRGVLDTSISQPSSETQQHTPVQHSQATTTMLSSNKDIVFRDLLLTSRNVKTDGWIWIYHVLTCFGVEPGCVCVVHDGSKPFGHVIIRVMVKQQHRCCCSLHQQRIPSVFNTMTIELVVWLGVKITVAFTKTTHGFKC